MEHMETYDGDSKSRMQDYELLERMGRGDVGETFLVLHKIERKKSVLKKIPLSKQTEKSMRYVEQEIDLLSKLRHPYILEYKDAWIEKDCSISIVTTYCEGGDMAEIIGTSRGAFFPEEKICKWLTQLLLALDYLHSHRVLHRDIKCSNIFLTRNNDIRLGDFGLAKLLNIEDPTTSVVFTANYMCPELREDMPYGYKSELWSLACCMFEIAAHQPAFRAPDMDGLINKINRSLISPLPILYTATLKQIIKSMLRKSPEHRPTAGELLRHPHLQPYLLRCRNASSVYLPVKSPNTTKEKTTKKGSPQRSYGCRVNMNREVGETKMSGHVSFKDTVDVQGIDLAKSDSPRVITAEEVYLVTKRVDPISYSAKSSNCSEESNSRDRSCETTVSAGDEHDSSCTFMLKENSDAQTIISTPNYRNEELAELSPNYIQQLHDGDIENNNLIDLETSCDELLSWETKEKTENSISDNQGKISAVVTGSEQDKSCGKRNALSPEQTTSFVAETETTCCLGTIENQNGYVATLRDDERVPISDGVKEDDLGERTDTVISLELKEKDGHKAVKQVENAASLLRRVAAVRGEDSKHDYENPSQQRADALEALLELCAQLLKQNKLDELSGVLKPFGEETVSSRETAIWLTKSLMNAQKLNGDPKTVGN